MVSEKISFVGSVEDAREAVKEIFHRNNYIIEWEDKNEGTATRDKTMIGFIEAHSCIPFEIHAEDQENITLKLIYKVDHIGVMWVFGIWIGIIVSYITYNKIVGEFKFHKEKSRKNKDIANSNQK